MLRKTIFSISFILVLLSSCTESQKFDAEKWNTGDGIVYAYRPKMVHDLVDNYKLKGLKYQQVIHLLHRPQRSSRDSMYYDVQEQFQERKSIYVQSLVLYLKDSIVTKVEIHEKPKKKK